MIIAKSITNTMLCIIYLLFNITHNKEVLNRRDSLQVGGLKVLPTLERGGRGQSVKAG
jgi:hypothetical protein